MRIRTHFSSGLTPGRLWLLLGLSLSGGLATRAAEGLEHYVRQPDERYAWRQVGQTRADGFTLTHLELVSQQWREHLWRHHLQVLRPDKVRNPKIGFLFITGDGDGRNYAGLLRTLAERGGAVAAVLTQVPNQPLYDGRREDGLIAYTFERYLESGDATWPLLFPMVKSAVRAMDTLQSFARNEFGQELEKFTVAGASKRGWTTWLTAAVDPRVTAIAPMVIDMLNMAVQLEWADKVYGKQSEMIGDYTRLRLHERMDEPRMIQLRGWVDPYSHRTRYTLPKLILLGSNDAYWTVDSLRHYWDDLPGPKLLHQTPNAGHDLGGGKEATQTLAAFFQMIADGQPLPTMQWHFHVPSGAPVELTSQVDRPIREVRLWTADSEDRDFRNDRWNSRPLEVQPDRSRVSAHVEMPAKGYRAYLMEVVLEAPTGHAYKLSTEARVTPDNIR